MVEDHPRKQNFDGIAGSAEKIRPAFRQILAPEAIVPSPEQHTLAALKLTISTRSNNYTTYWPTEFQTLRNVYNEKMLLKTCVLLPAIALAAGASASEKSPPTGHAPASKANSRVLGSHTAVAAKSSHAAKADSGHGGAHWTYSGAAGPGHWGAMKPAYAACKDGLMQSPIDLRDGLSAKPPCSEG